MLRMRCAERCVPATPTIKKIRLDQAGCSGPGGGSNPLLYSLILNLYIFQTMSFAIVRPGNGPTTRSRATTDAVRRIDFTQSDVIALLNQRANEYGSPACTMLRKEREYRGSNSITVLIPPPNAIGYVTRIKVANDFDWRDAEGLTQDMLGGEPISTDKNRHIDQIIKIDRDNDFVYVEIKKTSGHPFSKPTSILSSLRQFRALLSQCQCNRNCRGSYYLLWSIDSLSDRFGQRKSKYATLWLVTVDTINNWYYFDTHTSQTNAIYIPITP
jgi:hypothetical protein